MVAVREKASFKETPAPPGGRGALAANPTEEGLRILELGLAALFSAVGGPVASAGSTECFSSSAGAGAGAGACAGAGAGAGAVAVAAAVAVVVVIAAAVVTLPL